MAKMGRYCKAYRAEAFTAFPDWAPRLSELMPIEELEGTEPESTIREELKDEDILYLQESLDVTDGVFLDEHIVYSNDSDAWKRFCHEKLGFAIPEDVAALSAEDEQP